MTGLIMTASALRVHQDFYDWITHTIRRPTVQLVFCFVNNKQLESIFPSRVVPSDSIKNKPHQAHALPKSRWSLASFVLY